MTEVEKGADAIFSAIQIALKSGGGLLIGRNGTIELETILYHTIHYSNQKGFPPHLLKTLELHAGVFPSNNPDLVNAWCLAYYEALRACDVIAAGWYAPLKDQEETLLKIHNLHGARVPLRSLEPYYVSPMKRWSLLLENQKVAIVNAFADTALQQTGRTEEVWPGGMSDSLFPPGITWIPVKTGYAPVLAQGRAEWPGSPPSWKEAVDSVVNQVVESGARFALIGCGGLGMVLGNRLRERGVIAIVLGGALQVLFGIKGGRWASHPILGNFWNNAWVWPAESETPRGAAQIENACYWKLPGKN